MLEMVKNPLGCWGEDFYEPRLAGNGGASARGEAARQKRRARLAVETHDGDRSKHRNRDAG
jgi:hypothetical protein